MRHGFTFDGVNSSQFAVYISGEGTFDGTARDISQVEVPGRNGSLILDNGRYKNIDLTYPAYIVSNFADNFAALRSFLLSKTSYKELADDYHSDEFRLARYKGNISPKLFQYNKAGSFNIVFDCKPQRFLVSGKTVLTLTANGSVTNPTAFDALPLIRVYGSGQLGVGSDTVTIGSHSYTYIDIDCDTQDAFYGSTNCNGLITLSGDRFPVLHNGANGITLGTGITKVEITPRWWRL